MTRAVGTDGNLALPGGALFFEEIGERTKRRFLPLGTPALVGKTGKVVPSGRGLGLRPPRPTLDGPPTGFGGREKKFIDRRRK